MGLGQGGLQIRWDMMGLGQVGLQIRWDRMGLGLGVLLAEPGKLSQSGSTRPCNLKSAISAFFGGPYLF